MRNALYCFTLLTVLSLLTSQSHSSTIPGPQTIEGPPFSPWESVTLDYQNDPSRYIRKTKENENYEARGSLIWIPLINYVTAEAAAAGAIHPEHQILFSNLLFGLISVETTGLIYQTGNFGNTPYQLSIGSFRGLSQLVAEKLYLEENPYEPLTAIRAGLRNLAPFVYHAQNVLVALAEHNNGKTNAHDARVGVDAFCTIGQEFAMRTVNAAWTGHRFSSAPKFDARYHIQRQLNPLPRSKTLLDFFPNWDIFDTREKSVIIKIPNIPFNWQPPKSSLAWRYINNMPGKTFEAKQKYLIQRKLNNTVWQHDVEFSYPISHKNSSVDKSYCATLVPNNTVLLQGISTPAFIFDKAIDFKYSKLELINEKNWFVHYPSSPLGKTPASQNGKHRYLTPGSPMNDVIGIDKKGNVYVKTNFARKWLESSKTLSAR